MKISGERSIFDLSGFVVEAHRALKPGGRLVGRLVASEPLSLSAGRARRPD